MAKSILLSSMLLFFCRYPVPAEAQPVPLQRSHALQINNHNSSLDVEVPDSITIIAVRVSFQADQNRLTTGTGTFAENSLPYLENNPITIDPLPHDQSYFESHLEFAKNYFARVSDNQFTIEYRVLPEIYQLDNPMEVYSPTGETFSNEKLALLARDTWQKVEEAGGFDTSELDPDRTAFIIFHAGVGRDVQLTGTTLDITPQDIPSITLDSNAFSILLNDPSFNGFPVNNGTFRITNSLILPRTLSRRGEDFTGTEFVLQLSTNGLICASIGSYLGLPDLFNTETGSSGIGRFGLMDGESFFSYRGLFPPEPSAWEKKVLGWQTPFSISAQSETDIQLPAAALNDLSSIARYNLSSDEYFLVENRHRDPMNNGVTLTIKKPDGTLVQQNFENTNQTFVNQEAGFEELFEPGVLIDVDNYDWSLPGGLDVGADETAGTGDDRFLNGGFLIWHIDEAVIRNEINSHRVNANPERRGVDLEEADGAQDIGRAANDSFTGQARGWAFDFWWSGNNARVITLQSDTLQLYENRFSFDTRPSNHSNTGARSYFEFFDFSDNIPTATFRVRPVTGEGINPISLTEDPVPGQDTFISSGDTYRSFYPPELSIYTAQSDTFLIIPSQSNAFALQLNGNGNETFFDFNQPAPQQSYVGNQLIMANSPAGGLDLDISAWLWDGAGWQNSWQANAPGNLGFLSSTDDDTLFIDFTPARLLTASGTTVPDLSNPQQRSLSASGKSSILEPGAIRVAGTDFSQSTNTDISRIYTGLMQAEPGQEIFYLLTNTSFSLIEPEASQPVKTIARSSFLGWPALADFNGDQNMDILYVDGDNGHLIGRHSSGAVMDFFPITPPDGAQFKGTPLIADIDGDDSQDVLIMSQDSVSMNIYAYDQEGNPKTNFPLFVGSVEDPAAQPVHPAIHNRTLYAVSHTGDLKAWEFPAMQDVLWNSAYGNETYNKVTGRLTSTEPPEVSSELLVSEETYNWPNPASDATHIRYQVRETGSIEIKIITPGGSVIYDESFEATGGVPEEQRIDTSGWGNGIYLAMVTANAGGQQARKLIKIAVVQ